MAFVTLSSGLTLQVPTNGTRNWGTTMLNENFAKISAHDHTGGGKGLQIANSALAADAVSSTKLRLANNTYVRANDSGGTAQDILGITSGNVTTLKGKSTGVTNLLGDTTSGAVISLYASGHATLPGRMDIAAGVAAGSLNISTRAAGAGIAFSTNGGSVLTLADGGTPQFHSLTTAATAGASQGYVIININGTNRKIQYYAT